jgi:hypothetical protein
MFNYVKPSLVMNEYRINYTLIGKNISANKNTLSQESQVV